MRITKILKSLKASISNKKYKSVEQQEKVISKPFKDVLDEEIKKYSDKEK